jgi:hypothetical protein
MQKPEAHYGASGSCELHHPVCGEDNPLGLPLRDGQELEAAQLQRLGQHHLGADLAHVRVCV